MSRTTFFAFAMFSFVLTSSADGEENACKLTPADLASNANLSFDDFDQRGTTPSTSRKLGERGCNAEAAAASEHYLLFGPTLNEYQSDIVAWHMGQYLASAGDEASAARVIATTKHPPSPTSESGFDWNTYVVGTWAFLKKDRALLESSAKALSSAPGQGNAMNARVLRGLLTCFDKPYREAYGNCVKAEKP